MTKQCKKGLKSRFLGLTTIEVFRPKNSFESLMSVMCRDLCVSLGHGLKTTPSIHVRNGFHIEPLKQEGKASSSSV